MSAACDYLNRLSTFLPSHRNILLRLSAWNDIWEGRTHPPADPHSSFFHSCKVSDFKPSYPTRGSTPSNTTVMVRPAEIHHLGPLHDALLHSIISKHHLQSKVGVQIPASRFRYVLHLLQTGQPPPLWTSNLYVTHLCFLRDCTILDHMVAESRARHDIRHQECFPWFLQHRFDLGFPTGNPCHCNPLCMVFEFKPDGTKWNS